MIIIFLLQLELGLVNLLIIVNDDIMVLYAIVNNYGFGRSCVLLLIDVVSWIVCFRVYRVCTSQMGGRCKRGIFRVSFFIFVIPLLLGPFRLLIGYPFFFCYNYCGSILWVSCSYSWGGNSVRY